MIQIGDKSYYTVEDICGKTGMHPKTVREVLKSGKLRGRKQGKRWYVSETNLQAFFEEEPQVNE